MTTTFPRSTPSALGIDPTGVADLVRALEALPDVEPHSVMLLRHGRVAAEGWWAPYAPERPHLLYSLSKSFTAAAVGIAVRRGLVGLDDTVLGHFPELDAEVTDERTRRMRVRHLLAMASGHRDETLERARAIDPTNLVRGFLLLPPDEEPGTVFAYNQPCTYTLAAIVRRVTGGSLLDWLEPELFAPLGIEGVTWRTDDTGAELGFTGCYATTETVAKLGQLYLQGGVWDGVRILDEDWVAAATTVQVDNGGEANPDWSCGYGFQFWMARHGFRGDGAYGQYCVVLPEHDVVLAMTGQSIDMQAVLDAVWQHLLPAIDRPVPADDADRLLRELLAGRTLPALDGPLPDSDAARDYAASDAAVPGLHAVTLDRTLAAWTITLHDDAEGGDQAVTAPLTAGRWTAGVPVTASAATTESGIAVDVRFADTPHLLHLVLDPGAGTFSARWATEPLRDTIATLHRPAR